MLNQLKIGTKIGGSFAFGLALFAAIAAVSYRSTNQLIDASRRESHTYQILTSLEDLGSQIKDAETGQRGYIITGAQRYLEPYNIALQELGQKVKDLRRLTADNPNQQRRIDSLESLINNRLAVLKKVINLRNSQGFDAAQKSILTDEGRLLMADIRKVIAEIEADERNILQQRSVKANLSAQESINTIIYGVPIYSVLLILIGYVLTRHISRPLQEISGVAEQVGAGDLAVSLPKSDRTDEVGILTRTFNHMILNLRETTSKNEQQNWLKSNLAEITRLLQGQREAATVAQLVMSYITPLVEAQHGVFYLMDTDEQPCLKLLGSYAYQERRHLGNRFHLGEGLVGQCALEKQRILLIDVPSDYIRISSGLGAAPPLNIILLPILFETEVIAVIELASLARFKDIHLTFLEQVSESIGIILNTIAANNRTAQLLKQSQALAEELQEQQEELQESNRRLEEQAEALITSESRLKEQQEELQQANEELQQLNEELEEKAELLSIQKREVEQKNQEIEQARQGIEEKAEQLELSSKYKSEFLANMSHELRTPLNSLLILARLLIENSEGNLTEKQVEYSRTIYASGTDLLRLINDILDLAKIESGTVSIQPEQVSLNELCETLERTFRQVAQNKVLNFDFELDSTLPETIFTDSKRLLQVLKNLLSNAFKFTEHGGVTVSIKTKITSLNVDGKGVSNVPAIAQSAARNAIAFSVSDTGIGIAADKQKVIFEAFQQADGSTSRKYGGTGLGLSISRQLAQLLGGRIELISQLGQGSTFTLYIPIEKIQESSFNIAKNGKSQETAKPEKLLIENQENISVLASTFANEYASTLLTFPNEVNDDREIIQAGDRVLLIIEDDISFARILMEMGRQQGFKVLTALSGSTGLIMAQEFNPNAVMLDIRLPGIDGWTVLERLKADPNTRHIPVHILSVDDAQQRGLKSGAIAFLQKPVSHAALTEAFVNIKGFIERQVKNLLVIEDNNIQAQSIKELIGDGDVQTTIVHTGADAISKLQSGQFDCIVLDLGLPDMSGFELIERIKQQPTSAKIPIIVYTGKELTLKQESQLRRLAETIIVKDVRSPERLLDETALFLHRVQANLPQSKRQILEKLHPADPVLTDKKVLIVDDDVRNIFALTGLLEQYEMQVMYAENGRDAIALLQKNRDIDIILMDVMMPELDGYQTTRMIRQQELFKSLPIIALTAKAMPGDREKCLEAGASDYITKPVDTEQLLSLLRVWLYR